jgi:hypothetical protein
MVTINETGFSIHVETNYNPSEAYVETLNNIVDLLQAQHPDMERQNYHLLELLKEMLPNDKQAKAMFRELQAVKD